jgi:hypothetical protein
VEIFILEEVRKLRRKRKRFVTAVDNTTSSKIAKEEAEGEEGDRGA